MTVSSNGNDSQWGEPVDGAQRGPSFEDPTQSAAQNSEQSWDQAWGLPDQAQHGGSAAQPEQGAGPGAGGDPGAYGMQTAPGNPYGQDHQQAPYAAAAGQQDPYGQRPQDFAAAQQNPYGAPYAQQPYPYGQVNPYQQPYGGYGAYAYSAPAKSKTAAALLAFLLGGFGAHSFYLNKKNLGFIHLGLGLGSFALLMVVGATADSSSNSEATMMGMLALVGGLASLGNSVWAFVEFIIILITPEHELGR